MLGLRLDSGMEDALARVSRREGRTRSEIAREALRDYLARAEDDAELIAEVLRIAALTTEDDLARLDALNNDLMGLIEEEEAALAVRRAA